MKKFMLLLLCMVLTLGLCACGKQTQQETEEPTQEESSSGYNRPTQADAVQIMHYRWGERVSMDMKIPVGWCCESDEHNRYGTTSWNEDLPDCVGFDFWLADAPEFRFSVQCRTRGLAMSDTGVEFMDYTDRQKLLVAAEESSDGTVQITILFPEAPGDYVVTGTVSKELWWENSDRVILLLDDAVMGSEECISYAQALEIAQAARPELADAKSSGHYDVLTGEWTITSERDDGTGDVKIDADGQVLSGE